MNQAVVPWIYTAKGVDSHENKGSRRQAGSPTTTMTKVAASRYRRSNTYKETSQSTFPHLHKTNEHPHAPWRTPNQHFSFNFRNRHLLLHSHNQYEYIQYMCTPLYAGMFPTTDNHHFTLKLCRCDVFHSIGPYMLSSGDSSGWSLCRTEAPTTLSTHDYPTSFIDLL